MQNEKQSKIFKVHEKLKLFRKKIYQQTNGTNPRKMFARVCQSSFVKVNLKREKRLNEKAKGPTKSFSYDHGSLKPLDQKIQKFLPLVIFFAPGLHRGKKAGDELFRRKPEQPTNEKTKISTGNFLTCLKVSSKRIPFLLWDSSNFSKDFFVVFLK